MGEENGTMEGIIKAMDDPVKERVTKSGVKKADLSTSPKQSKADKKYHYRLGPSGTCIYETKVDGKMKRVRKTDVPDKVIKECEKFIKQIKKERGDKSSPKSSIRSSSKTKSVEDGCKDYKVTELKFIAKNKGIKGYSKMKKNELCEALGYK